MKAKITTNARRPRKNHPLNRSKITTDTGKVLALVRANGQWLVVQACMRTRGDLPVISRIVPATELQGHARRKAERWIAWLT